MTAPTTQRLARLLSLVPWLTRHPGVTIDDAAQHFGVSQEQLEHDLWLVICCGLPGHGPDQLIDIQFWDDDGRIDVLDPQTLVAPTRLTVEEAATLQVGLSILATLADEEDRHLIESTQQVLLEATAAMPGLDTGDAPGAQRVPGGSPRSTSDEGIDSPVRTDLGSDPATMATLTRAAQERRPVEIRYHSATTDEVSRRIIWPERIVVSASVAYVEAWCTSARDVRTFRAGRIRSIHEVEDRKGIVPRAPEGAPAPPTQESTEVEVRIHRDARWLLDTYDFCVTESSASESAWIDATIGIWDERWLIRLVLSMGGHLIVRSPRSLREAVHSAAVRGLAAYDPHETMPQAPGGSAR